MSEQAQKIAQVLKSVTGLERAWQGNIPSANDDQHIPWLPFPIPEFVSLCTAAVTEAEGLTFLEVGCGIGTKMLIAETIFGLDVFGIERVPEYVAQAQRIGLRVSEADAGEWKGYGNYDILWLNRPFRQPDTEAALETRIWAEAKPGAVVICANLEDRPPSSWYLIEDDWETRRGVWQKLPLSG
jgi:trans-aconitate methyltransferase